jgi:hypothetical protein
MGLRSVFAAALPGIFEAAGESATFNPATGVAIDCMVFIDFNVMLQPNGTETQVWERGTTIECLFSDIGREPNRGETFEVDGTTYTIQAILENDGLTVKMQVN